MNSKYKKAANSPAKSGFPNSSSPQTKNSYYSPNSKGRSPSPRPPKTPIQVQDWQRRLNPSILFDQLPQPFRFINKCLNSLILTPVFERIIQIENKKKRSDYQGNLHQIYPSGTLDIEGITCMEGDAYHPHSMLSSAFTPKMPYDRPHTPTTTQHSHSSKVVVGDKKGQIRVLDIGRKIVLSKEQVFNENGCRIQNLALHSQKWADVIVTTVIASSRSPSGPVKIMYYKSTDHKLVTAFEFKIEAQEGEQGYESMVKSIKISKLGDFVALSLYNGKVLVLRLPNLPDPIKLPEKKGAGEEPDKNLGFQSISDTPIENFLATDLLSLYPEVKKVQINDWLVLKVDYKQLQSDFDDPFVVDEDKILQEQRKKQLQQKLQQQQQAAAAAAKGSKAPPAGGKNIPPPAQDQLKQQTPQHFCVGETILDSQNGDASGLFFPSKQYSIPSVYFTHSMVVGKLSSSDRDQDLVKKLVTSNIYLAYNGLPLVQVYRLGKQSKPCMNDLRPDYSWEQCQERINAYKLSQDKSSNLQEKNNISPLLSVVKQIRKAAGAKQSIKEKPADPNRRPALRSFTLPYHITTSNFILHNQSHQWLGLGLNDGSVIIIDAVLAVEKYFLSKHSKPVSCIAFYSNISLISGSVDGVVHIYDMIGSGQHEGIPTVGSGAEHKLGSVVYKGNNTMDKNYPVVKCCVSESGMAIVCDIMGNARMYDLIRYRKICKMAPYIRKGGVMMATDGKNQQNKEEEFKQTWRYLPNVCFHIQRDIMVAVAQKPQIDYMNEQYKQELAKYKEWEIKEKDGNEQESLKRPQDIFSQAELIQKYCIQDAKTPSGIEFKHHNTIQQILQKYYIPSKPFYVNPSCLFIFKLDDIAQQLYHQIMIMMKSNKSFKECFWALDPQSLASDPSMSGKRDKSQQEGQGVSSAAGFSSKRSLGLGSFNLSGRITKVGGGNNNGQGLGTQKQKLDKDYEVRIGGRGVSPIQNMNNNNNTHSKKVVNSTVDSEFLSDRQTFMATTGEMSVSATGKS